MEVRAGALLAPVNWHSPMFGPLAVDRSVQEELMERVFAEPSARVEMNLLCDSQAPLETLVAAARRQRRVVLSRAVTRSPIIDTTGCVTEYEQTLSRNRRRALRRQRRRLEQLGELTFEVHDGSERLDELLADLYRVEASGWKGDRGTAIQSQPETKRFYTAVARWAAEGGWLRLACLRLEGRAIACDYVIEHGGTWYSLKAGYDEEFRSFGPGALLLREEIGHCLASGVTCLDLLGNEDAFKSSWADRSVERSWMGAFRRTPRGLAAWLRKAGREAARRSLRAFKK
ncbi:MAG TPA: GNAT family N-acetyltransferase [Thermoleophilaceae bacterium]|nr:GNAT family N-acetyltransferase [Thermoleophilaceae bacterium]